MKPNRFILFAAALLANAFYTKAQILSQQVIGTAGNEMLTPNLAFNYTIGESCVTYYLSTTPIVTEGFQQNNVVLTSIVETKFTAQLKVYPNPFGNSFTVVYNDLVEKPELKITDALGRTASVQTNITNSKATVDMQGMASGVYLLHVIQRDETIAVYRVVKTNP